MTLRSSMKDFVIGIDIGGTKIRAVLCSSQARWNGEIVIKEMEIKTPKNLVGFKKTILGLITNLAKSNLAPKIAIGIAGVVSGSKVVFSPNIKYLKNFNFKNSLGNPVSKSNIKVDNDARCFLRAELIKNALLRKGRVLGLTFGTGIGRVFAKNGKVLKIKKFEYPEHWEAGYQKVRDLKNNKKLADFLAKHLAPIVNKYSPDAVIVGGGVTKRKNFINTLRKTFRHSQECRNVDRRIIKSRLGQNAVAIGAALLYEN